MKMKQRRKLVKVATALIVKLGAVPATFYQYQMETCVGKLHISIDNDDHRNGMLVIFCRFDEPKRALAICPFANPYTGKTTSTSQRTTPSRPHCKPSLT